METLKQFKTILYGQKIQVFTDHKNLTYDNSDYSSDRVLRQRLLLDEYGVELNYVKGETNVVADALSRLPANRNVEDNFSIIPIRNNKTRKKEENYYNRIVFEDQVPCPVDFPRGDGLFSS